MSKLLVSSVRAQVHENWAPLAAARFRELVSAQFYDGSALPCPTLPSQAADTRRHLKVPLCTAANFSESSLGLWPSSVTPLPRTLPPPSPSPHTHARVRARTHTHTARALAPILQPRLHTPQMQAFGRARLATVHIMPRHAAISADAPCGLHVKKKDTKKDTARIPCRVGYTGLSAEPAVTAVWAKKQFGDEETTAGPGAC
jgi:hypothetical protein